MLYPCSLRLASRYAFPGASRMKWFYQRPHVRRDPKSLLHYPTTSDITYEPIDYMHKEPYNRNEEESEFVVRIKNLPMGRTPEFLQERMRRFFSKYGTITHCRCNPHPLDPFQCDGTGYICFDNDESASKAARAVVVLPPSLHSKVLQLEHATRYTRNDTLYAARFRHNATQVVEVLRQLYQEIAAHGPRNIDEIAHGIFQKEFGTEKLVQAEDCIIETYGSWEKALDSKEASQIFQTITDNDRICVAVNLASDETLEKRLQVVHLELVRRLQEKLSVPWRLGRMPIKDNKNLLHLEPLPEALQVQSSYKPSKMKLLHRYIKARRKPAKAARDSR